MKPFDFKLAKQGHPVCTEDGQDVRIVCFDRGSESIQGVTYPIVALIKQGVNLEKIETYCKIGEPKISSNPKLMLKSVQKEGWINIYEGNQTGIRIFDSKEEAFRYRNAGHITTIKIEWEE